MFPLCRSSSDNNLENVSCKRELTFMIDPVSTLSDSLRRSLIYWSLVIKSSNSACNLCVYMHKQRGRGEPEIA